MARAVSRIRESEISEPKVFQLFQPMGGVIRFMVSLLFSLDLPLRKERLKPPDP